MNQETKNFHKNTQLSLSIKFVEYIFFWLTSIFASFSILTHFSQITKVSFQIYSYCALGIIIILSGVIGIMVWKRTKDATLHDVRVLFFVLLMGFMGMALTLVSHRSDADDYNYVPNAVYHLQHPTEPLDFLVHFIDGGNQDIISHLWGTSLAFEYMQAVIAYFLKTEFLFVYYILTPALIGFLIPLVSFYLLSHFSDTTSNAVIATILTLGIILLLGETHRTLGNFSFTRAFQGKTVCIAIGIPLFTSHTIRFFTRPGVYSWLGLLTTVTSMSGVSTSTFMLLAPLSVVLFIVFLVISKHPKQTILLSLPYFLSFAYLFLYVALLLKYLMADLGGNNPMTYRAPRTFLGHAKYLYNADKPVTLIVVILATVVGIALSAKKQRLFLISWIVSLLGLFLNPLVAPLVMRYVTTPAVYWRMFYLYPLPLITGIAVIELFARIKTNIRLPVFVFLCALLTILHLPKGSTSAFHYRVHFGWPHYKLPDKPLNIARKIVSIAPPGTMLAPYEICGIIPMISSNHPQLRIRKTGVAVRFWLDDNQAILQIYASLFVGGHLDLFPAFNTLLEQQTIASIVIKTEVFKIPSVKYVLKNHQFKKYRNIEDYVLVVK